MHPKLRGGATDLSRLGALALQRAGHTPPVGARVVHDGRKLSAEIEWLIDDLALLKVFDRNRVTEDGAEAVALAYLNCSAGWVIKRRMNRGEGADWLLLNKTGGLALEVSGTTARNAVSRLREKREQVARCTLPNDYPVSLLAVVVAFREPLILASRP